MSIRSLSAKIVPRRRFFAATGMAAALVTVVAGAIIYPGFVTTDVVLNDGSVWVTNRSANMVGHLNAQSKVLDGGFTATTENFNVLQQAATVFMDNDSGTLLNPVDVSTMALGQDTAMTGTKKISLGSTLVAFADSAAGKVWLVPTANVASFDQKSSKPTLTDIPNAAAVVVPGAENTSTVFVLNPQAGELLTLTVGADAQVSAQSKATIAGLPKVGDLQLTAVGDQAAVLDPESGTLFLPNGKTSHIENAKGSLIQQPSASGDAVAVETATGLVLQPLDGGQSELASLSGTGTPIAPVQQRGCVHAAWTGANKYLFYCPGADSKPTPIPKAGAQSRLVFRQNRDVVVLNDMTGGDVWLINQNMQLVNNWDDIKADLTKADDPNKDSTDPNVVNTLPDRTKPNRPPVAVADTFGVRAGATTVLPILFNDSDPDGDVLTARPATEKLGIGELQSIYGGTGLQVVVPAGTPAKTETFSYTADDGRGGTATAQVSVRVVPDSENSPPVSLRPTSMVVVQGQSIAQNVLADMSDPDGDSIFLVGAKAGDDSAEVKFTPDGELTYLDNGQSIGAKTVTVSVSDNRAVTEKKISVTIKPGGVPPVANADHVRVVVGQTAVVAPLKNDQDPGGGELRLASVDKPNLGTASPIADNGTFTFTSDTAGVAYLNYQVTNGPQSSTGLIRIDVVAADEALAPVAVKDTAMMPTGGTVLVDVLGNDSDPAGGILVVKGVDVPANAGISVTVLDHKIVKITDLRSNGVPLTINYTVANGYGTTVGSIAVVQIPAPTTLAPPMAKADVATVRVGDVVRIPVLANDSDPNGDLLKHPEITQSPESSAGKLWVDEDSLRFLAGTTAGTFSAIYKITNSSGQSDSAAVSIHVLAADPQRNLPPAPKNVEGRVLAGSSTRIQIPLDGIDPDGDSVQLMGVDTAPHLGTAIAGNGFITYTAAGNAAGTDSFTYKVKDSLGAEAVGNIQVGVAPVDRVNHPPKTEDDFITIRPGRQVALDVLLNDADPDGDILALRKDGFSDPAEMKPSITKQGRVLLRAPTAPGISTLGYTVADPSGATAKGTVHVTVTVDAPLRAPIARDDSVSAQEALGKNTVDVPVLKNDEDPDGVAEALKVTLTRPTESASVLGDGLIRVNLTAAPQMIPYTVTDQDKLSATAIIWVPGTDQQYPVLKKSDPIKLVAGTSATLKLNDYVKVRDGHTPRITQADKVKLIGAPSEKSITADGGGITYAANPDFYGPGSITFEVTDGMGPDDPAGLKSTLTVMTEVTPAPATNLPPTVTGTALEVAQLETATLDLSKLAKDPENDALTFKLSGAKPEQVTAEVKGAQLSVKSSKDAVLGAVYELGFEVSDGKSSPVKSTVALRITSSTKPLAVANEDVVPDAQAGRKETVDVLANDTNPFPDTPLKLVDVKLVTGAPGTTVEKLADKVVVGAPESFTGNVVVSYTVEDKTGDHGRWVDGRITLNVKGKPAVPPAPRVQEIQSKQVMLQWGTPVDNGSPLTGYTVLKSDGGSQDCASNTCLITGLTNAVAYTFTVSAKNAVGSSAYSRASAPATPDASPATPAPPTVKRGDNELTLGWVTPVGEYSAVKSYNVQISPAPPGQNPQKSAVTGNSLTWTGLRNGTEYTFRVQAVNNAPEPSAWSQYSQAGKPAGKPLTPGAPTLSVVSTVGATNQVKLDWVQPDLNGGVLKNYSLNKYLDGVSQGVTTTTTPTATVSLPNGTGSYTFAVAVSTEVNISDLSPRSNARRSVSEPGTVTGLGIVPANTGAAGGAFTVNFAPPSGAALGGSTPGELSYWAQVGGRAPERVVPGGTVAATNGQSLSVQVYVTSSATTEQGKSVTSNAAAAYGIAGTPGITASNGGQGDTSMRYSWSAPGANTDSVAVRIDEGGGFGAWISAKSGSGQVNLDTANTARTIKIQSKNSKGDLGQVSEATGSSGPPVPFTVRPDPGPAKNSCTVPRSGGAYYFDGSVSPATCNGTVNNSDNPGGQWLSYGDGAVTVDSCSPVWNTSGNWYRISSGRLAGNYVRPPTVNIVTGTPPC